MFPQIEGVCYLSITITKHKAYPLFLSLSPSSPSLSPLCASCVLCCLTNMPSSPTCCSLSLSLPRRLYLSLGGSRQQAGLGPPSNSNSSSSRRRWKKAWLLLTCTCSMANTTTTTADKRPRHAPIEYSRSNVLSPLKKGMSSLARLPYIYI